MQTDISQYFPSFNANKIDLFPLKLSVNISQAFIFQHQQHFISYLNASRRFTSIYLPAPTPPLRTHPKNYIYARLFSSQSIYLQFHSRHFAYMISDALIVQASLSVQYFVVGICAATRRTMRTELRGELTLTNANINNTFRDDGKQMTKTQEHESRREHKRRNKERKEAH